MSKIIKVEYTKGYTIVDNTFLRDESLDLNERGLLVTMLSLPENWDYKGIGLTSILPCGKTKVFNALKKLEEKGYIKRSFVYQNGKISDCDYEICGSPIFRNEDAEEKSDTLNNNSVGNKTVDSNNTVDDIITTSKNKSAEENTPVVTFYNSQNLFTEKLETEKWKCNKITKEELTKDKDISNLSIYPNNQDREYSDIKRLIDEIGKTFKAINSSLLEIKSNKNNDCDYGTYGTTMTKYNNRKSNTVEINENCANSKDYYKYVEVIKDNIEYNTISTWKLFDDGNIIDEIVSVMAEVCAFSNKPYKINGNLIPAELVKSAFLKLTSDNIVDVVENLEKYEGQIRNIKSYLIASLYNSYNTININYSVMGNMVG